ncbi:hypothetical protein L249_4787 [Ophiocordyceps polyrhachis-furcata BCC 54312]|uniref:Uncharacterized protein n=1 Tax=Ophiocordyceps polyrhachis-furcata BCC 54312 TaxID=1330021 RepID=A0A367L2X7_9HYPO|nr:hypothetical protein L249_4787 [Ophiocordyceps polyrhachis-furcata BCC 54312]
MSFDAIKGQTSRSLSSLFPLLLDSRLHQVLGFDVGVTVRRREAAVEWQDPISYTSNRSEGSGENESLTYQKMLIKTTLVSAVAALASLASAESYVWVKNKCPFDIDVLSGGTSKDTMRRSRVENGYTFEEVIIKGGPDAWKHLKIVRADDVPEKPHIQFSYYGDTRSNSTVYGLDAVMGGGWLGHRIMVEGSSCPPIVWRRGLPSSTKSNDGRASREEEEEKEEEKEEEEEEEEEKRGTSTYHVRSRRGRGSNAS